MSFGGDVGTEVFGRPTAHVWGPTITIVGFALGNILTWMANENSWPFRYVITPVWRRLFGKDPPKLLYISNRAEGVPRHARPRSYWAFDLLSPAHLVTSYVLSTSGLLALHFITLCWYIVAVCVDVIREYYGVGCGATCSHNSGADGSWVTFLTNWSLTLFALAALVAFINTARHLHRLRHSTTREAQRQQKFETRFDRRHRDHNTQAITGDIATRDGQPRAHELQQQPQHSPAAREGKVDVHAGATNAWAHLKWDWLSALHLILMETATSAAFFVSFWYWVGVVGVAKQNPGPPYAGTVLAHVVNTFFALLQVALTRLPIVSYHYQVLLWYGTLYFIFLTIYGGVWHTWRYGLDWYEPRAAIALFLIPPITIIMFTIWYFVALVREGTVFTARKVKEEVVELHERHHEHRHHNEAAPGGDSAASHASPDDATAIIVHDGQQQGVVPPHAGGVPAATRAAEDVEAGHAM